MKAPRNNPIGEHECTPETLEADAISFWTDNGLSAIVSREEFILSVFVFQDLDWAINVIGKIEELEDKGWGRVLSENPDEPNPTEVAHEDEDASWIRFRHSLLQHLNYQQRESIKVYYTKSDYVGGNVIKRFIISCIELLLWIPSALKMFRGRWENVVRSEEEHPKYEQKSTWYHLRDLSKARLLILVTCMLAAFTQGWDQSSMNGANVQWAKAMGLNMDRLIIGSGPWQDVFIFSCLNAAPFFSGALVGSLLSDPFINEFSLGRRWAITFAAMFSLASVVGAAFTKNWQLFMLCRLLLGIGMGAKASVVPIFISEIAPEQIRGMLCTCWQLMDTFGIFLGSAANLAVYKRNPNDPNWRFMIALAFIPALMVLTIVLFCVESPRWLLKKNRMVEALKNLIQLYDLPSHIVACGDLYLTFRRLKDEEMVYLVELEACRSKRKNQADKLKCSSGRATSGELTPSDIEMGQRSDANASGQSSNQHFFRQSLTETSIKQRFNLLFRLPRMRNAVYASVCVMVAQQACGINILAFMSSTLFANALPKDHDDNSTYKDLDWDVSQKGDMLKFSLWVGMINFLCTWIAFPIIDLKGRRPLLHFSFSFMAVFLIIGGGALKLNDTNLSRKRAFEGFALLFTAAFSVGEGPTAFVIASEIFPLLNREMGMSHAVFWNFLCASILAFLIPVMNSSMAQNWFWIMFGFLNILFWRLSSFLVRETSKETLENINGIYSKPKRESFKEMFEGRSVEFLREFFTGK